MRLTKFVILLLGIPVQAGQGYGSLRDKPWSHYKGEREQCKFLPKYKVMDFELSNAATGQCHLSFSLKGHSEYASYSSPRFHCYDKLWHFMP